MRALAVVQVLGLVAGCTSIEAEPRVMTPAAEASTQPSKIPVTTEELIAFDRFVEDSWNALALRNPESLTASGVSEELGLRDDELNDLSPAFIAETQALETSTLDQLHAFDEGTLTPDQVITYDTYEWYLERKVEGHEFWLHDWQVHYALNSYNQMLISLFAEIHPLTNRRQAEDYIARLDQVGTQVDQVIGNLELARAAGILPPTYVVDVTIDQLRADMGGGDPLRTVLYARFVSGLEEQGLSNANMADLSAAAETAIERSFIPAWDRLVSHLERIRPETTNEISLRRLPSGDRFYEWLLRWHTSTALTPQELHAIGLEQVVRVTSEILIAYGELGFRETSDLGDLYRMAVADSGVIAGSDQIVARYETLINEAAIEFDEHFSVKPIAGLTVLPEPGNTTFYLPGSVDGSRPGFFHAGTSEGSVPALSMPTTAYHEAIPGHHFQISPAQEGELPSVQRLVTPAGYVEGWGLYAERLAREIGLYQDDPHGNIGRLQLELLRAARMVVDTGIHALGWSRDEAIVEISEIMGSDAYSYEVDRYVTYPAQASSYMVGLMTLLDLRERFARELGEGFELARFHEVAIGHGNLPLEVLSALTVGG